MRTSQASLTLHLFDKFIPQQPHAHILDQFFRFDLILQEPVLLSRQRPLKKVKVTANFEGIAPILQGGNIECTREDESVL